jgi:hypothetical protein
MPGENDKFQTLNETTHKYKIKQSETPELLPVSCGYFFSIVKQLLLKQRKMTIKYILLDSKGILFDKLVQNIQYHSLSDLLMELMQLNLRFE